MDKGSKSVQELNGKPRCVRILAITAGSSTAVMSVKGPPHCGETAMSISHTRVSHWAQLRRACVEAMGESLVGLEEAVVWEITGAAVPNQFFKKYSSPSFNVHH